IEIDRNVNTHSAEVFYEVFKMLAPVVAQNGAGELWFFWGPVVRPGMNFENACSFGVPVSENLVRPPTFKISAAPNCDVLYVRKFQRAIDPTAATPFRRAH